MREGAFSSLLGWPRRARMEEEWEEEEGKGASEIAISTRRAFPRGGEILFSFKSSFTFSVGGTRKRGRRRFSRCKQLSCKSKEEEKR